jgi:hypothetical protein
MNIFEGLTHYYDCIDEAAEHGLIVGLEATERPKEKRRSKAHSREAEDELRAAGIGSEGGE